MTFFRTTIAALTLSLLTACAGTPSQDAPRDDRRPRNEMRGERPPAPDLTEAAAKLGVSKAALEQALRDAGGPRADFDKVAATLGVSAEDLKAALPPPPRRR